MNTKSATIEVKDLKVDFVRGGSRAHALRGVSLSIRKDEIHGLVGESGSGKTVTAMSIIRLLPQSDAQITSGSITFEGEELLTKSEAQMRAFRGQRVAMVFQEPSKYLNPSFTVRTQIVETLQQHLRLSTEHANLRAASLLEHVGLGSDARVLRAFPHELSSGMRQRAMIAIAISCNPDFLIADEPTTSLDVTMQSQILKLLKSLKISSTMGMLFISHDLNVIKEIADRISVIYAGKIVETGSRQKIFDNPLHPYTRFLLLSIPDPRRRGQKLAAIRGQVLDATEMPEGCVFAPRCPLATTRCFNEAPLLEAYEEDHSSACYFSGEQWNL